MRIHLLGIEVVSREVVVELFNQLVIIHGFVDQLLSTSITQTKVKI